MPVVIRVSLVFGVHVSGRTMRERGLLLGSSMSGESLNVRPGEAQSRTARLPGQKSIADIWPWIGNLQGKRAKEDEDCSATDRSPSATGRVATCATDQTSPRTFVP